MNVRYQKLSIVDSGRHVAYVSLAPIGKNHTNVFQGTHDIQELACAIKPIMRRVQVSKNKHQKYVLHLAPILSHPIMALTDLPADVLTLVSLLLRPRELLSIIKVLLLISL